MRIERVISWFDKDTESLVSEKNIDCIRFETLKTIFIPPSDDPLLYNSYDITGKEASQLNQHVAIHFEFDRYWYQLDCFQVSPDSLS